LENEIMAQDLRRILLLSLPDGTSTITKNWVRICQKTFSAPGGGRMNNVE
jgi:hypothetical protein